MSVTRYFNPKLRAGLMRGEMPDWLKKHTRKSYIIAAILSAPDWVDRPMLQLMRECAKIMSAAMGEEYVLDHIVPLNHELVCGLTVPWNFQIVTRKANAAKSNHMWPDSPLEPLPLDFEGSSC